MLSEAHYAYLNQMNGLGALKCILKNQQIVSNAHLTYPLFPSIARDSKEIGNPDMPYARV